MKVKDMDESGISLKEVEAEWKALGNSSVDGSYMEDGITREELSKIWDNISKAATLRRIHNLIASGVAERGWKWGRDVLGRRSKVAAYKLKKKSKKVKK